MTENRTAAAQLKRTKQALTQSKAREKHLKRQVDRLQEANYRYRLQLTTPAAVVVPDSSEVRELERRLRDTQVAIGSRSN